MIKIFSLLLIATTALTACAPVTGGVTVHVSKQTLDINASNPSQRVEDPMRDELNNKILTLNELLEAHGNPTPSGSDKDKLTAPALRDNALHYGIQGGLAWGTRQIQQLLRERSTELGRTYDFNALVVRGRGSEGMLLPPVISEASNVAELQDGGRTLRVADHYYEILQPAKLVQRAPLWQTYLSQVMESCCSKSPDEPSDPLPKTQSERDLWRKYVTEGWDQGLEQASEVFQKQMRLLQRDFTGMARYTRLVEEGKAIQACISDSTLGNTGTGQNMRVNDKVVKITCDARLNVNNVQDWKPAVMPTPIGEGSVPAGERQPQPRTEESKRGGQINPGKSPGALVPAAATTITKPIPVKTEMPDMGSNR